MPWKPKHYCRLCNELVESGQSYCNKHKPKEADIRGSQRERGYTRQWERARLSYLRRNPLCVECLKEGIVKQADVVDHIEPHKGDYGLFWDESNWQSLCIHHHNSKTAKENKSNN